MLVVRNLHKEYPTRTEPLVVLQDVSLELPKGRTLAVVGPSGCGKSTLLHVIGTLDRPSTGNVTLDGDDPFTLDEPKLAAFRNHRMGFVFQDHHLLPQCTALENVLLPAIAERNARPEDVERAKHLLNRVGLSGRLDHRPAELSGGERQRTAIARALILKPSLLLADEPTGNLDRTTAQNVADLLLELQQQEGLSLIVVTHSPELAARFERRVTLDGGRLVELA